MILFLVGFMGCGKSTAGRRLADRLGFDFVDLDEAITEYVGMSINEMFARYGESEFRKIESKLLDEIDSVQDTVVATGGGTPCFNNNIDKMKNYGLVIYFRLSEKCLFERLKHGRAWRPKIAALDDIQLEDFIKRSMEEREKYYSQAQIVVDCDGKYFDEVVDTTVNALKGDKN